MNIKSKKRAIHENERGETVQSRTPGTNWSTMGTFSISVSNIDKFIPNLSFGYSHKLLLDKC
jgi:hypothetical protein